MPSPYSYRYSKQKGKFSFFDQLRYGFPKMKDLADGFKDNIHFLVIFYALLFLFGTVFMAYLCTCQIIQFDQIGEKYINKLERNFKHM